ncbi:intermembrane transport protein PqiB [Luteolibacter algae]|uniref:Intermembrane transport protein PqiB n=1 Tax=Luteolibacter algae TaxID=454151 RepID=A0ABW5D552_9BACT
MSEEHSEEIHPAVKDDRSFNPVWIVPIVALLLGLWLVKRSYDEKGELITVRFENAADLAVGKTEVKCSNVTIGKLENIILNDDLDVDVSLRIKPDHLHLVKESSQFWVVRARVQGSSVSGLGTLISGAYIELDPGALREKSADKRFFLGLETPPLTPPSVPGLRLVLESARPGSVDIGSGIYYRDTIIGRIESREFLPDEKLVRFGAFIEERYSGLVNDQTLFWKTSGVKLDVGTEGFNLELPSLDSLVSGRVSVDQPDDSVAGVPISNGSRLSLYDSEEQAEVSRFRGGAEFLLMVDQSLRGLKEGAPVEFRGFKIGRVAEISYSLIENPTIEVMPVLIQLDARLLETHFPEGLIEKGAEGFTEAVSRNLQASLRSSSLITGQMFVDLDYFPGRENAAQTVRGGYPVLPVVEVGLGRLEDKLAALLDKINTLELDVLVRNLSETSAQATATLAGVEDAVSADGGVIMEAQNTLEEMRGTLASVNALISDEQTKAIPADLRLTLSRLNATLEPLSNEGAIYGDLRRTLDELRGTIRSIDRLTTELADKPNSLLFGKDPNTKKIPRARR